MGELTSATLERVESAAKDALVACARVREEGEGARILLDAARGAYMDALELHNAELTREALEGRSETEGHGERAVALRVVDGIVDTADAVGSLA